MGKNCENNIFEEISVESLLIELGYFSKIFHE